jgi:hypothetical protein
MTGDAEAPPATPAITQRVNTSATDTETDEHRW